MTALDGRPPVTSRGGRPAPPDPRPDRRPVRRDVGIAAAGGAGVVAVVLGGLLITSGAGGVGAADLDVVERVGRMHSPLLDGAALLIDRLLGPQLGVALVLLLAVAVGVTTRRAAEALTVVGVSVLPWAAAETVKLVVGRDRPDPRLLVDPLLVEPHSFSFPSGHTALATGLALAIVLVVRGRNGRRGWQPVAVVAALGVVLVAASRVWIGVHYPTDTIASVVLGCSVVALALPLWRRIVDRLDRLDRLDRPATTPPGALTAPDTERNAP
ncbi:phosphatase PAP2 family protein [Frigoribacterium sp. CFBP 8759]|uniref:phosphatase PAP2 family protein n=1 Tax=unclassified Frigoribacterium TaxID=2627005 RepID=UPI0012FC527A|nr:MULTISPECIES: phosphatase PAP2 family protein [unclassified Frigoribacterium]MBD8141271.1 phosphatase PAP2 family protein [Frigoribacterium sp. CFBP 13605]MBD8486256.1 phosphatase PAP2 family protein [Frigoribacterium sp. CFBP 8759]